MTRLWAADYGIPSPSDIQSVAYASGGGFRSEAIEFEPVDEDLVYAPSPYGAFPGELVKPRCRHCRQELAECPGGCSTGTGDSGE